MTRDLVLVDSSIWVRSWRPGFPKILAGLTRLLEGKRIAGHPFVFGELLAGDQGGRRERLSLYKTVAVELTPVPHVEVVTFVQEHRLTGHGLGWIDCHLLAAAVAHGVWLWSADEALMRSAQQFGVAFTEAR